MPMQKNMKLANILKKMPAIVLAFAITLAGPISAPVYAQGFSTDSEGNLVANDANEYYYMVPAGKEDSGKCVLYAYGGSETDLVLPERYDSCKVTTIGMYFSSMVAFVGNEEGSLKTVKIPSGYTKIESGDGGRSGAFQNQTKLYRIEIPKSVKSIGKYAFTGCDFTKLTIVAPKGSYAEKYAKKYKINYTNSTKVAIDPHGKTMNAGKTKTVSVYNNGEKVSWKSSKPSVAAISADGVITAKKAGRTKITATIAGKKYSFTLTVKSSVRGAAPSPASAAADSSAAANSDIVSNLKQTEARSNSFQVSWDANLNAVSGYEIEVSDNRGGVVKDTTRLLHYTITRNISPATHYTVRVRPKGGIWSEIDVVTKPKYKRNEGKLTREADGSSATEMSISWKECTGADAYRVEYWDNSTDRKYAKSIDVAGATGCTLTGLVKEAVYEIRVYPYCASREPVPFVTLDTADAVYASASDYAMIPDKISKVGMEDYLTYAEQSKLSWSKSGSAAGYQWEARSGSTKTDGGLVEETYVYSTKLKMNKFYRVRVRGYIYIDGEKAYGKWSDWQYVSSQPKKLTYKQSAGKLALSWSKVSGATSYTVYVSAKKPSNISEMTKVKTVTKNTCTLKKLGKKSIAAKKRYYMVIVANKETAGITYRSITKYIYQTK